MKKLESIQEFYESRFQWIPNDIRNNFGHFNVFPLQSPAIGLGAKPLAYGRREWYNIVLVFGGGTLLCSDKQYPVKKKSHRIYQSLYAIWLGRKEFNYKRILLSF